MRIHILPAMLLVTYLFASCKKNDSNTASDPNKLKMYIEDARNSSLHAIDSFTVTYDNQNRVTGLIGPDIKTTFAYPSANTFSLDLYNNNQLSIHETNYINSGISLVDSTVQYDDANDSTTEGYIYNGKLPLRKSTYDYSTQTGPQIYMQEDYTYDNAGNMIKNIQSDGHGNVNTILTFTYTDKALNYSIQPVYLPAGKYLPATQTETDGNDNEIVSIVYTYEFDSSGRVTKEMDTADNGESVIKSYIYY
jgi:hypothetical protein